MVNGKIKVENIHFLYEAEKNDLVFIPIHAFSCDKSGNLFLEKDVECYASIAELKRIFGLKHLPIVVPVKITGDDLNPDGIVFYFDLVTEDYSILTISKFEAENYRDEPEYYLCIENVEQIWVDQKSLVSSTKKTKKEKDKIKEKESKEKEEKKQRQKVFLEKVTLLELESQRDKAAAGNNFALATELNEQIKKTKNSK